MFRDTYQYFLTEEEIERCIEDYFRLWLDADQITERLEVRQECQKEYQEALQRQLQEELDNEN